MDLVDYSQERFEELVAEFEGFARSCADRPGTAQDRDIAYIPISALNGDNVVERSEAMPWYDGPDAAGAARGRSRSPTTTRTTGPRVFRCSG